MYEPWHTPELIFVTKIGLGLECDGSTGPLTNYKGVVLAAHHTHSYKIWQAHVLGPDLKNGFFCAMTKHQQGVSHF